MGGLLRKALSEELIFELKDRTKMLCEYQGGTHVLGRENKCKGWE